MMTTEGERLAIGRQQGRKLQLQRDRFYFHPQNRIPLPPPPPARCVLELIHQQAEDIKDMALEACSTMR